MRPPVTDHAALRYAERVLEVDVPAIARRLKAAGGDAPCNAKLLVSVGEELGVDPERLRAAVVPEAIWDQVRACGRFGCRTIKLETHILKLQDGCVITVFAKDRRQKLKITSKRERRQGCQRMDRRRA
jgi:hypothetical protein